LASLEEILTPRYLILEDPTHVMPSKERAVALLDEERALPRSAAKLSAANPLWEHVDAEEKAEALAALDWSDMRRIFADNAPWDLRPRLPELVGRLPTLYILPESSVWVPSDDVQYVKSVGYCPKNLYQ
jgi:hypothetical protein